MADFITDTKQEKLKEPRKVEASAGQNVLLILQGKIGLEAIGDKIIIVIDKHRTGYECKLCDGVGKVKGCSCVRLGRPGFGRNLTDYCPQCFGNYAALAEEEQTCPDCLGKGATLVIPDAIKAVPTSGVIVSAGPKCTARSIGERVLFGAHTGYYLPFKGNVKVRCMREDEPLCLLHRVSFKDEALTDLFVWDEESL